MPFENYSKAHMFEAKMLFVDEREVIQSQSVIIYTVNVNGI